MLSHILLENLFNTAWARLRDKNNKYYQRDYREWEKCTFQSRWSGRKTSVHTIVTRLHVDVHPTRAGAPGTKQVEQFQRFHLIMV